LKKVTSLIWNEGNKGGVKFLSDILREGRRGVLEEA
jgi:hypothetical protein